MKTTSLATWKRGDDSIDLILEGDHLLAANRNGNYMAFPWMQVGERGQINDPATFESHPTFIKLDRYATALGFVRAA